MGNIYRTIKVPLKTIIKNPSRNIFAISRTVETINKIVIRAYQFVRLYILTQKKNSLPAPIPNAQFCYLVLSIVSSGKKLGRKPKDQRFKNELLDFYDRIFYPLLDENDCEKIPSEGYSEILQKLAIEMETSYSNNILKNFFIRLKDVLVMKLDERISRDTKEGKKLHSQICRQILNGLFVKNRDLVPLEYQEIYDFCFQFLPSHQFEEDSMAYDIEANTLKYLDCFINIADYFSQVDRKLFQSLSLRNNIVPKHIPINIKALIYTMPYKNFHGRSKGKLIKESTQYNHIGRAVWSKYFKLDSQVFNQPGYSFYNHIDTDGVGCSILFIKSQYRQCRFKPKVKKNQEEILSASSLSEKEKEKYKGLKTIGLDPGPRIIAQLVDDDGNHLKYTSMQKGFESFSKCHQKTRQKMRKDDDILELEQPLDETNCKTLEIEKFQEFIKIKNQVNTQVYSHYCQPAYRKMRLRVFINQRQSEDRFLNRIEEVFGRNIVIGYGNWSRNSTMRGLVPCKGKSIRRLISKRFYTLMIDEYNTSKRCYKCDKLLVNFKDEKNKKIHRCQVCVGCLSLENKIGARRFINRDINGAMNILRCLEGILNGRGRPECLQRPKSESDLGQQSPSSPKVKLKLNLRLRSG